MPTCTSTARSPLGIRRACLLVRKSNKAGEDNCSIPDQRNRGTAYIAAQGWAFNPETDIVEQVVSGWKTNANRDKIHELVDLTCAGRYDVVVVLKLDRYGRRVPEVTTYFDRMAESDVLLASVTEGIYDLRNPTQLAFAQSLIVHAQMESGNTSVRVSGAREEKRKRGFWQGGVPFGWEIDCETTTSGDRIYNRASNESKRLRRRADQAATLDQIIEMATTHHLNAGAIAKRLNIAGIRTARDAAWNDKAVRRILVNPVLAGWVPVWDRDPKTGKTLAWSVQPLRDADGNPFAVNEAAISPELYLRLYARFGPKNVSTRDRSGRALLTGLLLCGSHPATGPVVNCGRRLTGSANPTPDRAYHCPNYDDPTRCRGNTVTQLPVERYITDLFLSLISAPGFAGRHAELVACATQEGNTARTQAAQQLADLGDLAEGHRQAAADAVTPQAARDASLNYDRTLQRIEEAERALGQQQMAPEPVDQYAGLGREQCEILFRAASRDQQRAWLATVIDRIVLLPSRGRGAVKGAFGSRGMDPRRIVVFLKHDATTPVTAPEDWEGKAPDFGEPTPCADCAKVFKNRSSLASHRRYAHGVVSSAKAQRGEPAKRFACPQKGCERIFFNEAALRNHLWHAHQVTEGYECPKDGCDRRFALPAHLGRHVSTIHSKEKEFCVDCAGYFKVGGLWLHQKRAHDA